MRFIVVLPALLALGACTQTGSAPPAPTRVALPEPSIRPSGPGCGPQIAHFREILAYDLSVGRVAQAVSDKAQPGIAGAESACAGGRTAEATAALRRTKTAAGYP